MNVSASEARETWADIVNRVEYGGERIVIEKRGRPVAVLVSVEDAAALDALEDRILGEMAAEAKAEMEREGGPSPWEDVKARLGLR